MFFKRIESTGLAHYSYMIGEENKAFVIDPRRDCDIYIKYARENGFKIEHIFETHRNEDYVIGSCELSNRTGAKIWHADSQLDYMYGEPAEDGQTWMIGGLRLKAIFTPGHTPGSMSYLLHDSDGYPWIIFTGDTLFAGDIGRVDLPGLDLMEKMAEKIYDSLFNKILPIGDDVIVCPGHGAGSVCGTEISSKVFSTIGAERKNNPKLQNKNKDEFIKANAVEHERPPYFRMMEKLNLEGPPILGSLPFPPPLSPKEFEKKIKESYILDTRMELKYGASHIDNSLFIWEGGIASFIGWFLSYEKPILLVNQKENPEDIVRCLVRLGYDNVTGYLSKGMFSWHMSGRPTRRIKTITANEFCDELKEKKDIVLLDVRNEEEIEKEGEIKNSINIHLTQLKKQLKKVEKGKPVYVFCGSGLRSMVGASILEINGWKDIRVVLGGLSAWKSTKCDIMLLT